MLVVEASPPPGDVAYVASRHRPCQPLHLPAAPVIVALAPLGRPLSHGSCRPPPLFAAAPGDKREREM